MRLLLATVAASGRCRPSRRAMPSIARVREGESWVGEKERGRTKGDKERRGKEEERREHLGTTERSFSSASATCCLLFAAEPGRVVRPLDEAVAAGPILSAFLWGPTPYAARRFSAAQSTSWMLVIGAPNVVLVELAPAFFNSAASDSKPHDDWPREGRGGGGGRPGGG